MTVVRNRDALASSTERAVALDCVTAGVEAAHPRRVVAESVSLRDGVLRVQDATYDLGDYDRVLVLGAGKAAGEAARALEAVLGDRIDGGAVVTDSPTETDRVEVLPGDHPTPSETGVESAERVRELARSADADTLVLAAITGGGSALLTAPAESVTLDDVRATTDALLRSGASIHDVNAVRKHLSAVKGGRLARDAAPARVVTLAFSDVVGDDLDVIASGPTVPDDSTYEDALRVLDDRDLAVPAGVRDHLERGAAGDLAETPSADDPAFERASTHLLANGWTAIEAARETAESAGFETVVLSSRVEGEASDAGRFHAAVAAEVAATGNPAAPPVVVLSGGELTVTVRGDGRGGPNQECALAAAAAGLPGDCAFASIDTDGIDGASEVAGAVVDAATVDDADEAREALRRNDAGGYLAGRHALVETGQTGTNVNDLRALVVSAGE